MKSKANYRAEYSDLAAYFFESRDDDALRVALRLAERLGKELTGLYHVTDHGEYDITPPKEG